MSDFDIEEEKPAPRVPPPHVNGYGRSLPHSVEAEEYLLSCLLLDAGDVVPRCRDAKISADSYYETRHGIVFDCILSLHDRGKPVDTSVVAEELKTTRQLDAIGGYAFLTQVSSRIPTTAQAGYFIDKVKEQAVLRGIIRQATGTVEDCYNFSGGIDDFATSVRERIEAATAGATGATQTLGERKFDPNAQISEARVVLALGDVVVSTAGNLTSIVARAGVGKSAVVGAIIAAGMSTPTDDVDCLGFSGPNYSKLPLLHFDTEQSKGDYQKLLHRSLRRSKRAEFPSWLHSYHLTGLTAPECRQMIEVAISAHARKAGGLFGIIIDGWADLVVDPNDGEECFPFVARMHALAIKHDTPIIGVLHLNPGSEGKSRGHLGSQLERKSETVLQLDMNEDQVTAIYSTKKRGAPIPKDKGPRFQWNDSLSMHALVPDWQEQQTAKRAEKAAKRKQNNPTAFSEKYSREEQVSFYPPSNGKPELRAVVFRKAREGTEISPASLERVRLKLLTDGWIVVDDRGFYKRTKEGDDFAKRRPGVKPTADAKQETIEM